MNAKARSANATSLGNQKKSYENILKTIKKKYKREELNDISKFMV